MYVVLRELNGHTEEIGRCCTMDEAEQIGFDYEKTGEGGTWFWTGEAGPIDDSFPKMEW